jgi:hypothetical protein
MSFPADPSGGSGREPDRPDFDHAPLLMKVVFAAAGLLIMSLAAGVIPADPAKFRAPHGVVFAFGFAFFLAAVLMFIGRHRFVHPALYMFIAALMTTSLAALFCWVAFWSTGPFGGSLAIGPIAVSAPGASDVVPRLLFGAIAMLAIFLAALGWFRWWRALRGLPVDLSS